MELGEVEGGVEGLAGLGARRQVSSGDQVQARDANLTVWHVIQPSHVRQERPTSTYAGGVAAAPFDMSYVDVFKLLGKRWNGVIIGALSGGPASFSQLARGVTGISDSVLSDRLTGLAGAGIVTRVVDSGPPVSVTYALSEAGQALLPAMDELRAWAGRHL